MGDDATPQGGTGEAPPATVPAAGGDVPGGTPVVQDAGGTGVDPLLGRLRQAGVSANDLDQVSRYYKSVDEVRGFKARMSEFESQEYKDRITADDLMAGVDPNLQDEHKEWRKTYSDRAYIDARRKQLREVAAERPEETPSEELIRRIERMEKADKARSEKALQSDRQRAFDSDLSEIVTGLKLKKEVADFLVEDINQSIDPNITNATQLADFAQKRLARINALMASDTKAAPPTPVVAETPPPPSKDGDKAGYGDDGQPLSMRDIVKAAAKRVSGSMESGAS